MTTGYIDTKVDNIPEPVFVTAFDETYRTRGIRMVAKLREKGYKQKIIVYAMDGVTEDGIKILRKACNVEIRFFNFSRYPEYFRKHKEYRFKSVILTEVLAEYQSVWWMDSSIIFLKSNISYIYDIVDCRKNSKSLKGCSSPYLLHFSAGHGTIPVTHKNIYNYIPTDLEKIKRKWQYGAGLAYVVRTKQAWQDIMKWYFLCALEEECMAPKGSLLKCALGKDLFVDDAGCNRFDQSIINLVLINQFNYDPRYFTTDNSYESLFIVDRSIPEKPMIESRLKCLNT